MRFVFDHALREGATIGGVVSNARTGTPLESFDVKLRYRPSDSFFDGPHELALTMDLPRPVSAQRSGAGRFIFEHVPVAGVLTVVAEADGYVSGSVSPIDVSTGAADMRIALDPVASLRIRVMDAHGVAAPMARVIVLKPDTQPFTTPTYLRAALLEADSAGVTMLDRVAHGTYSLQAFSDGATSPLTHVDVAAGAAIDAVLQLQVSSATGTLTACVLQPGGAPMDAASVTIVWESPLPTPSGVHFKDVVTLTEKTLADGTALFEHLQPGIYFVLCNDLDRGLGTTIVAIDGQHPATITLQTTN